VHWVEAPGYEPFWAVTRPADIMEIERNNTLFLNAPRPLLATGEMDAAAKRREADGTALRTLIHMDDPQHKAAQIAVHYPLYVILSLLGLPESDFPRRSPCTSRPSSKTTTSKWLWS